MVADTSFGMTEEGTEHSFTTSSLQGERGGEEQEEVEKEEEENTTEKKGNAEN